ncbi:MAG TPA: WD40 repeat domain-containing protein [Candidatus Babeliales bacterium]|nr:WD40 repeat domain-containing protein [Candidatus Babeliales bacterium]
MKNLKNYIKNNQLFQLILLCAVLLSIDALAMRRQAGAGQSAFKGLQRRVEYENAHKDQYFLYATDDPNNGIWVDKNFLKENCGALKNMIADFGETQEVKIPIVSFPLEVTKLGFDVLADISKVPNLSFAQLINVANIFNFLEVPANKMQPVLDRILANFNDIPDEELKKLNSDVQKLLMQKLLMIDSTVNYLKNCIIKKYAQERKQVLEGHPHSVDAVAFSPDGKQIVSGSYGWHNLILWDVSNPNKITHQVLEGHPHSVYAVAFSPDGKRIVSGGNGQNNLIMWDMSNPNKITHQVLEGHPNDVIRVAFSPDGKHIVSCCQGNQNNLIVWDVSDPNHVTHQVLVGHPDGVNTVAFSPDGKRIVSGSYGDQNNLIVWDVSDPNNITHQVLVGHSSGVKTVAFSPDGKHIVSGCYGNQNNLIVWDVSNPNNITHQVLKGHPFDVYAVAFSPDGKQIVSGSYGDQNNLILWDVSNPNNITHQVLVGHSDTVRAVAFSPDGKQIVSGSYGDQNNLIVWDVSNPNHITHQVLVEPQDNVTAVAFSTDGKRIVSANSSDQHNLRLWTLLTDQEDALLKQLENYSADQIRLIYRLRGKALRGEIIKLNSEELKILPQDMQKLLTDLLVQKGWFSGLWGK